MICYKCKNEINVTQISRTTECPSCHADLHVCKACKFYSPGSHYDCKESIEDPVSDKDHANFCDWFKLKEITAGENDSGKDKAAAARDAFNSLFN
ncbi:MAG: hypothetical protein MJ169_05470 [Treponema sp.]|nr:hypothetical protein [Treponema sp.]